MNKLNAGIIGIVIVSAITVIIAQATNHNKSASNTSMTETVTTQAVVTEAAANTNEAVDVKETAGCTYAAYSETWSACEATDRPGICTQSRTSVPTIDKVNENGVEIQCGQGTQTRPCPCPTATDTTVTETTVTDTTVTQTPEENLPEETVEE